MNTNLKVIILAAGQGKRLLPLTKNNPKCLVKLFGKSLLEWQMSVYENFEIDDISIVKGYLQEKINIPNVNYFINLQYEETNMIETLFCAREKMFDSIIISYGDIIFEKEVFDKLYCETEDISLIVDENWLEYWKIRFDNPLGDAESMKINSDGYITNIGQKVKNLKDIQGQYIGLMKFQNDGLKFLKSFYEKSKSISKNGKNPLNSTTSFEKSYMSDLLQNMINEGYKIKAVPIRNGWLELDSYDDYQKYQHMLNEKTISKFFNIY